MSWETSLMNLYKKNESLVGTEMIVGKKKVPFIPVFHDSVRTAYEIILTESGHFVEVKDVEDSDSETIIPVYTGARTSGVCAQGLCDTIKYLSNTINPKCHEDYMDKLGKWCASCYSHPTAQAVYTYIKANTIDNDILSFERLKPKNQKKKNAELIKANSFVRFSILGKHSTEEAHCWTDKTLHNAFILYIKSLGGKTGLDYLSGQETVLGNCFPKGIRQSGDQTSLISANKNNFLDLVFTGILRNKDEAASIGAENAYKIINTLKWAIRTTGTRFGTMAVAVWNSGDLPTPDFSADTYTLHSDLKSMNDSNADLLDGLYDIETNDSTDSEEADISFFSEQQVIRMLNGYSKKIPLGTTATLIAIDSATDKGRCSIVTYLELDGKILLENISRWHQQAEWRHKKWIIDPDTSKRKKIVFTGVPGIKDIANLVYGKEIEENGYRIIGFRASDKNKNRYFKQTADKLIPCIWYNRPIPYDIVKKIIDNAMSPSLYNEPKNWERIVSLACSFYKKYIYDKKGEVLTMALNKESHDRSYLFGRYLAVADYAEKKTYDFKKDAKRVTNAKRYLDRFLKKPAETYLIIRQKVEPYLTKHNHYMREKVINPLFAEIANMMDENSFISNEKLTPMFLLGYDSQMYDLYEAEKNRKKDKDTDA